MLNKPVNSWLIIKLKKGNKMFTMLSDNANLGISMVQGAKKEWVKQFVKDEKIAEAMNGFVDAQTNFAKQVVKTGAEIGTVISKEIGQFPNFKLAK